MLYMDIEGSEIRTSYDVTNIIIDRITDGGEYIITKKHLLKLCDDTLVGNLKFNHLTIISFSLIFSDYFYWISDEVGKVISDWDTQNINFPISTDNLKLWKIYLETSNYNLPCR